MQPRHETCAWDIDELPQSLARPWIEGSTLDTETYFFDEEPMTRSMKGPRTHFRY